MDDSFLTHVGIVIRKSWVLFRCAVHCNELAYVHRAGEKVGYAFWEALCKCEFSEACMRNTIDARRRRFIASLLLDAGMSARERCLHGRKRRRCSP